MKRMGTTGWVLTGLGLVLLAVLALRLVQLSAEEDPPETVEQIRDREGLPVVVAEADEGPLEVWRTFSGTVTGERESVLRARTEDEVREVRVRVGERVQAGQVLLRQAGRGSDARVRQARAALEQAERRVERLRPLWEAGALSDQDWEDANTALELARADLEAIGDIQEEIAPIGGMVTEVQARIGLIPSQGDPLVRIVDDAAYRIPLRLSPEQAGEVRSGQPVRLPEADDDTPRGAVDQVSIQADPRSRLVEVEVRFPGAARTALRPGAFVTVQIQVAETGEAIRIPRTALRPEGVWVLNGEDRVELREVRVGLRADDQVQILEGVRAGERVITEGASLLSDGARARVVD